MKPAHPVRRSVARTVLMVGEGQAEELFLRHLSAIYVQRGSGVRVTIKNAKGKGALHVVDYAARQSLNADYDVRAVLLDTDTGWNQNTAKLARRARIEVLEATPCLEATLLQMHGRAVENRTTAQLKQTFNAAFGSEASVADVFPRHFSAPVIAQARLKMPLLERIFSLLTTGM